jgi:hypothetical protein
MVPFETLGQFTLYNLLAYINILCLIKKKLIEPSPLAKESYR